MPTLVSPIQTADVDVLKCIFFQSVKTYKEILWYGLDCNITDQLDIIETGFIYLQILESECTLDHQLACEIKTFIKKLGSVCIFSNARCYPKYSVIEEDYRITEDNNLRITQDSNKRLING